MGVLFCCLNRTLESKVIRIYDMFDFIGKMNAKIKAVIDVFASTRLNDERLKPLYMKIN